MSIATHHLEHHGEHGKVFQWRTHRHRHILASGTGIVLIIFLVLAIFWVAVGACSIN